MLVVDTPGQVELFAFREASSHLVDVIGQGRACLIFLFDPMLSQTPSGFVSQMLLSSIVHFRLGLPTANFLSKSDLLEPEVLETIPPTQKVSIERDIYPKIAGNGLYGFPFEGYFIDSGTPESYLDANFKSIGSTGTASHTGASIRGPVVIHETAQLEDCIIGPNTIIGADVKMEKCVVRNSVILSDVEGYGGVVENCILGPEINFESDLKRTLISPQGKLDF